MAAKPEVTHRPIQNAKNRSSAIRNAAVRAAARKGQPWKQAQRLRGVSTGKSGGFVPPEDWYEPTDERSTDYQVIEQSPGHGYIHVVGPDDIRKRLSMLPAWMLEPLEVVQLSQMTRKKKRFPCYGMQWGNTLYLYPIEESLVEYYVRPPRPAQRVEATQHGGKWVAEAPGCWKLEWSTTAIKDFYLNNVLIHELGHLLDKRNTSYVDRERYAEWFALEYGYKSSRRNKLAQQGAKKAVRRRHHTT